MNVCAHLYLKPVIIHTCKPQYIYSFCYTPNQSAFSAYSKNTFSEKRMTTPGCPFLFIKQGKRKAHQKFYLFDGL